MGSCIVCVNTVSVQYETWRAAFLHAVSRKMVNMNEKIDKSAGMMLCTSLITALVQCYMHLYKIDINAAVVIYVSVRLTTVLVWCSVSVRVVAVLVWCYMCL